MRRDAMKRSAQCLAPSGLINRCEILVSLSLIQSCHNGKSSKNGVGHYYHHCCFLFFSMFLRVDISQIR